MHVMTHARWAIVLFQLRGPTSGLSHMLRMEFGKLPYLGRMRGRNLQDNGPLADNVRLAHCAPGKPASTPAFAPLKPQSSISTLSTIPSSFPSSCDTSCAFLARETYPHTSYRNGLIRRIRLLSTGLPVPFSVHSLPFLRRGRHHAPAC